MADRSQNEHDFPNWADLPDGGRRYWIDQPGRVQGFARYIKIVDANEITQRFTQEIYNDQGRLIATHQKYPVDTGHQVIEPVDESKENDS
ncbi:MAG: hypothetical protein JXJ20_12795 [Anaerolineae bacterium]|nr:hypothetical protein [Anaerolineae bacterium]